MTVKKRCVCGYTRFREDWVYTSESVQRWMLFDSVEPGFGSTPLGTLLGGGYSGAWGLFDADLHGASINTVCEKCSRIRSSKAAGGSLIMAGWLYNGRFYVVASDVWSVG